MSLQSALIRNPLTVSPATPVREAIGLMYQGEGSSTSPLPLTYPLDCVVVVADNQQVVGLLTERDVVRLWAQRQLLDDLAVGQAITGPVLTLRESALTDSAAALALLQQNRVRHVPIVDDQGRLVGLVTTESLQQASQTQCVLDLQQNSQRFREAQRIAKVGSWELDLLSNRLYWSEEVFRIFEVDPSQFDASYETFLNLVHPDDCTMVDEAYRRHLQYHQPYSLVHRLLMADGRIKYLQEHCETHYAEDGSPRLSRGTVQDITAQTEAEWERQQAVQALAQLNQDLEEQVIQRTQELTDKEAKYRGLMECAADAIMLGNLQGYILEVNQKAAILLGYSSAELTTLHFSQLHPPEELPKVTTIFRKAAEQLSASSSPDVLIFQRRDGSMVPVEFTCALIKSHGEFLLQGIFRDISERQAMEQALRASEAKYRQIIETAQEGVWIIDAEAKHQFGNAALLKMLGRTAEEMAGRSLLDFFAPELHPHIQELLARRQAGIAEVNEVPLLRADGSVVWTLASATPLFDEAGQYIGTMALLADITDRKLAEATLQAENNFRRLILENLTEGLCVCQACPDYPFVQFTVWNPQMEVITGYTQAEINERGWYQTLYPDPEAQARAMARMTAMRQGDHIQSEEWTIRHRDGSDRILAITTSLLLGPEDGTHVLAVMKDVTEQKQAQQLLQHNNQLLQGITQAQAQFITAQNRLEIFEGLLTLLLDMTDSEYGFIGEVLFRDDGIAVMEESFLKIRGVPYLKTHSITNIAWDEVTQKFYEENYEQGMEFTNMNTLFGAVIMTGRPVIANSPSTDPRRGGIPEGHPPLKAFLGLPFFSGDTLIGMVGVANRPGGYTLKLVETLQPLLVTCSNLIEGYRENRRRRQAEVIIHQQAEREALLRQISQRIRQSLDLQVIFDTACQEICQALQADRVGIFKFYPDAHYNDGEFVAESPITEWPSVLAVRVHDHCFGENFSSLYAQGRYYAADDIENNGLEPCHSAILTQFGVRANLVLPLQYRQQLWGLLCIHQCSAPRQWQTSEIALVQQLANQLSIAIYQASLYDQAQMELLERQRAEAQLASQLRQQQALATITQLIHQEALELPQILVTVTQQVREALKGDRVIVFRLYPDGRSQIVEESVVDGLPRLRDRHWPDEVWSQEILDCYWQGQPRIVPDVMDDTWTDCLVEYSLEGQIQSKMVAPILQEITPPESHRWVAPQANNKLWGVLVIHACTEKRVWLDSEARLLQQVANQVGIAIHQANLFEQLQQELGERQRVQSQLLERNEQLAITNTELERATRLKDEFLANMSHELRTPLNAVLGMTEGLQEGIFGLINDKQLKALRTVESSANHLLSLINDILDVAKIESGQVSLDYSVTSIEQLCYSSLAFVKQQALKKQIRLETNIPPRLPAITIDEIRMRQVLLNLLTNAVKFTSEGGRVKLAVSVLLSDPGTLPYLRLAITDTGIGIAPENIAKLFKPFVQIDSALNRKYTGTGLGLALVKQIVELHGGRVGLTSELGVGSCFTVDLPYRAASSIANSGNIGLENEAALSFLETGALESARGPLILLAEDEPANVITISSYLEAKGYRLICANDGREALELALAHPPDLVLMDVQMPEMDGLEAIRKMRQQASLCNIPIIALTALAAEGDRERCLAAGADDYLSKPVRLKQLDSTIKALLGS
ncbi:PAS domain S-box protein [Synechocystis sp. LKSZ1]|uniref:PAS domain S-box protein n=1 Tax=Synechocystis sp. LKSZ1 TaxID=3144951 RepID=UPI00336C0DBF